MKLVPFIFLVVVATAFAEGPPRATIERFCIDCHDADAKKGGVDLDSIITADLAAHAAIWEKVVKQLNARHMPPIGKKRPDEAGYADLVAALTKELDAQPARPIAGPAFRRLTRTEYQNAVRDLLAVEFDAKAAFPTDEISHGFDNITVGDLPPALLDRYLSAAQKIARSAAGASTEPEITAVRVRPDITQEYHVPGLPLGTRGGVLVKQVFQQTGEYEVQVRLQRDRNEQVEGMHGEHQLADQWLYLRNLDAITPDARLFPDFDHNLRESLRTETSLLFADIVENDRSVLDLLRTDRTWLDERLAAHYGIPHIHGSRFREVKLAPEWQRGGLLRHGSILTVTSYATRTSPVIRGHWILKNLLATEPPPPPPNVPALDGIISENLPIRERLAKHREMAACASCHNLMDPVGFALENYDAIGLWQAGADARGGFADGSEFDGVGGLEEALLKRPELFVTALTEKALGFRL